MGSQEDLQSTASTSASGTAVLPGKRKQEEEAAEEVEKPVDSARIRLRPRRLKKPAVEMEDTDNNMEVQLDPADIPLSGEAGETSEAITASESENPTRSSIRKKKVKNKRSGPTIESQLREVPPNLDEFSVVPASQLGASALEWLDDLEIIRIGSGNLQGGLQSQMKRRVNALKEVIRVLAEKVEDIGDPAYLRRRNAELAAELKASKRETERLRRDLTDLRRVVDNLQDKVNLRDRDKNIVDKACSPPVFEERPRTTPEVVVMRPPIGGVAVPIPVSDKRTEDPKKIELELAEQIRNLRLQMRNIRQNKVAVQRQDTLEPGPSKPDPAVVSKPKSKIISNVQLVPPPSMIGDSPVVGSMEWTQAQSRKAKYKARKQAAKQQNEKSSMQNEKEIPKQSSSRPQSATRVLKQKMTRKPPRTAAVAIKVLNEGLTYSEVMRKVRESSILRAWH